MRILLIAEACNPTWSSTPLQAYQWYRHLRELADVTLVTQVRNRPGFEAAREEMDSVHFVDTECVAARLHRFSSAVMGKRTGVSFSMATSLPAYYAFERAVWKHFGRALKAGRYDIVHRLTPSSPAVPSWLASRCPVPFVLGPLIGSLPWAPGTAHLRRREGEWVTSIRSLAKLMPYWRSTYAHASAIFLGTAHSSLLLWPGLKRKCIHLPWNGVDITEFAESNGQANHQGLHLLFVGRMTPLKQPALLIKAAAQSGIPATSIRVTLVGDGPERESVRSLAAAQGMADQVNLPGWVAHRELVVFYRQADLLVLPSVHESGGAVLLEAMACGLPCAVVDYGGPAEYVSAQVGFKVPLGPESQMIQGFAAVFRHAHESRHTLQDLRHRCRAYVQKHFDWRSKAAHMLESYRQISDDRAARTSLV